MAELQWTPQPWLDTLGPLSSMAPQLLDMYVASSAQRQQDLATALAHAHYNAVKRAAHAIKGSASQMCCEETARIARQIEVTVADDRPVELAGLVAQLEESIAADRAAMLAYLATRQEG